MAAMLDDDVKNKHDSNNSKDNNVGSLTAHRSSFKAPGELSHPPAKEIMVSLDRTAALTLTPTAPVLKTHPRAKPTINGRSSAVVWCRSRHSADVSLGSTSSGSVTLWRKVEKHIRHAKSKQQLAATPEKRELTSNDEREQRLRRVDHSSST